MRLFVVLLALLFAGSAQAVQVSPLGAVYPTDKTTGTLTLTSTEATAKTYQIFVERWTVENGKAVRKTADPADLRLLPGLVTIEAGKRQVVRFAHAPSTDSEQAYRLVVQEILDPVEAAKPGLHKALRLDFPWFWRAMNATPQLQARWQGGQLLVTNTGTATAQLARLTAGATKVPGLVGYVLPGETHAFDLQAQPVPQVSVVVNGQAQTLTVQ
jgi:fimbrial chaperone protein